MWNIRAAQSPFVLSLVLEGSPPRSPLLLRTDGSFLLVPLLHSQQHNCVGHSGAKTVKYGIVEFFLWKQTVRKIDKINTEILSCLTAFLMVQKCRWETEMLLRVVMSP